MISRDFCASTIPIGLLIPSPVFLKVQKHQPMDTPIHLIHPRFWDVFFSKDRIGQNLGQARFGENSVFRIVLNIGSQVTNPKGIFQGKMGSNKNSQPLGNLGNLGKLSKMCLI